MPDISFEDAIKLYKFPEFISCIKNINVLPVKVIKSNELKYDFLLNDCDLLKKPFMIQQLNSNADGGIHKCDHIIIPEFKTVYECFKYITSAIGEETPIQIIDVSKQEDESTTLLEYMNHFCNKESSMNAVSKFDSNKIYNLISLEISFTILAARILGPKPIREIDWIDQIWPISRRAIGDYPRVQKYCLISQAKSYTDFHIDFGGTSVWYHVLFGKKIFYMIPPTKENLSIYDNWLCSKKQSSTFFGSLVKKCYSFELSASQTFIIPSGDMMSFIIPNDIFVKGSIFLFLFNSLLLKSFL